ncbi:MAG: sugar-binding protein [Ignavibacteria bacterium]|nr:sugar-binding protein [Ignavibacteria bacterium]MBI3765364.1 sugar-binding protein [Ignavibacteriales bacterium]
MKKFNLIVGTIILILFGCGKKAEEKKFVFAFVPKLLDNPVFQVAWQGAQAAAQELGRGTIEVQRFAPVKSDAVEQAQIIESLIEKKVDGIAISVNDADALKESIDKAMDAGIPVVTFDSDAPKSKRLAYYGTANMPSGKLMGEYLVKHMGTKGSVAILMGTPGAPNLEERKNGLLEYLKDYPDIKVVATEYCYDDVNKGVSVMEAAMQAHPDLTGWVLPGAWALFTPPPGPFASKKPNNLTVIAIDALPEELDYVRQGYVQVLLGQKLWGWGYESVRLLKEIKEGKSPQGIIDSGVDVVTKENVEEYAQKWKTGKF